MSKNDRNSRNDNPPRRDLRTRIIIKAAIDGDNAGLRLLRRIFVEEKPGEEAKAAAGRILDKADLLQVPLCIISTAKDGRKEMEDSTLAFRRILNALLASEYRADGHGFVEDLVTCGAISEEVAYNFTREVNRADREAAEKALAVKLTLVSPSKAS